jgi:serine/threonine protein kinase
MSFPAGSVIAEYQIVKKLGEGGMGEVYLAVHSELGQRIVIKSLHRQLLTDGEMRERFVREAETMSRMSHPNILKIYNLLDTDRGVFILMEFLEGENFEDLLNRVGRVSPLAAIELMIPVLSGMEYSHHQGVIHRDIKPANLMVLHDGGVRVLDFGIAKLADRPGLTRIGMTLGTATYMSPEQHMGKELTEAADIYSLGVTLFEMCTGRLPFEAENTKGLIRKVLVDPPPSPRVYLPDIPVTLETMILKCLAKKPEERYQSAAELEAALIAVRDALG